MSRSLLLLLLAGCDSGGGGGTTRATHAICDQYVACVGQTTPQGLAAVLAAYGSSGACWTSAAESVCLDACRTGLRDTAKAFPSATACVECLGNDDCAGRACVGGRCVQCSDDSFCGGQTPACSGNTCVECTSDAHCPGRVCDRATSRCATCVADSDCPKSAPHCKKDGGAAQCVGCVRNSDCPGGACESGSCCQPESCAELAQEWSVQGGILCGTTYSLKCSGANVTCPSCSRGSCDSSNFNPPQCTTEGTTCVAGMSGACLGDEVCTYVPGVSGYQCAKDRRGSTCVFGGASQNCGDNRFSCDGANLVNDGVCRAYCLTAGDCRPSEKCSIFSGLGYGECI